MATLPIRPLPGAIALALMIAVVSTSGCGSDPPETAPLASDDGPAAVVAAAFRPAVGEVDAACIATGIIERLGAPRVDELHLGEAPFDLLGYALTLPIDQPDARGMVDSLIDCTAAWKALMITGVTEGTDRLSEATVACIGDALPDDVAREIFVIELARPYDEVDVSAPPDLSHLDPLIAAIDECATDAELAGLDWN